MAGNISVNTSALTSTTAMTTPSDMTSTQLNALQITHIVFLSIICLIGTVGNIMTIIAVKIERKLRESLSNLFVINLAIADLVVCAIVVPMMITHDAYPELFGTMMCYVTVSISGVACHTAAATMTCIALTRYVAASRATQFHDIVTRKRVYLAIGGVWLFAVVNSVPILFAWFGVDGADLHNYVCVCFDGAFALYYTLGPVFIGHFLPHATTIYCYFCIMRAVHRSRKRLNSTASGATSETSVSGDKRKSTTVNSESEAETTTLSVSNWSKHEIQLLKTSVWIIGFFSFCWIPYGVLVLLQNLAPLALKQTFGSLCLLSFSLNPVIYGMLSKSFRRAYRRIVQKALCGFCGMRDNSSFSGQSTTQTKSSTRRQQYQVPVKDENNEPKLQYGRSPV